MATAQELVTDSACLDACLPQSVSFRLAELISIFAAIAGMPADAQTLVTEARCLDACLPQSVSTRLAILISVAQGISGGGGSGSLSCGAGEPVAAPSGICGIYLDTDTDALYVYRNGAWILKA